MKLVRTLQSGYHFTVRANGTRRKCEVPDCPSASPSVTDVTALPFKSPLQSLQHRVRFRGPGLASPSLPDVLINVLSVMAEGLSLQVLLERVRFSLLCAATSWGSLCGLLPFWSLLLWLHHSVPHQENSLYLCDWQLLPLTIWGFLWFPRYSSDVGSRQDIS